jgi:hypothetical protein
MQGGKLFARFSYSRNVIARNIDEMSRVVFRLLLQMVAALRAHIRNAQ